MMLAPPTWIPGDRVRSVLVALALALCACSEVPASNPFDPETPAAQQEKGTLTGTLRAPECHQAGAFAEARVELVPAFEQATVLQQVDPDVAEQGEACEDGATHPGAAATFVFADILGGAALSNATLVGTSLRRACLARAEFVLDDMTGADCPRPTSPRRT